MDEKNPKALIGKGQGLFGLKKFKESIDEYDKLLNIEQFNKTALISKANSLMNINQKENALELYKRGIELNEDKNNNCIDLINYILCLLELKELDEIKNIVNKAEKLYEEQKCKMTEKEKNFVEKNLEKIKRKNKRLFK